ncbi:MAG: thioesterase [Gemmatimonas sp.]|nr:thioesterase [Gemmatimonas sp.]
MDPFVVGPESRLQDYLYEHIPISAAMGVTVEAADENEVRLRAPLDLNINHRSTVFGGSAAAVAILAGWSLLHLRLGAGGHSKRIVIQRNSVDYTHPIDGDFDAVAVPPAPQDWARFTRVLRRRGRGRIELIVELRKAGRKVGESVGAYVVLPPEDTEDGESAGERSAHVLR